MRDVHENLDGDLIVAEPLTIWGTVTGNVRVVEGGRFYLRGRVYGSVQVEAGGRAHLLGSVKNNLSLDEETKVILSGVVGGDAVNRGGRLFIQTSAKILGKVRTASGKTVVEPVQKKTGKPDPSKS